MENAKIQSIKRPERNYRVERPVQTGFSSPATHYNEPRIDLNEALVQNGLATFFIRVTDNDFEDFDIVEHDVLIIDKSLVPKNDQLVLAIVEDAFEVRRIKAEEATAMNIWGVITYIVKSVL